MFVLSFIIKIKPLSAVGFKSNSQIFLMTEILNGKIETFATLGCQKNGGITIAWSAFSQSGISECFAATIIPSFNGGYSGIVDMALEEEKYGEQHIKYLNVCLILRKESYLWWIF